MKCAIVNNLRAYIPIAPTDEFCTWNACGSGFSREYEQQIVGHASDSCEGVTAVDGSRFAHELFVTDPSVITINRHTEYSWNFCPECTEYYLKLVTRQHEPVIEESPLP